MIVGMFFLMYAMIVLAGVTMLVLTAWHHWENFVNRDESQKDLDLEREVQ
jgi:hypothetical protein